MRVREDYRSLNGTEKAAILLLSLGEDHVTRMFELMDDDEIRELSSTMASLGTVSATLVERLFMEFAEDPLTTEVPDPYYGGPSGFERVLDMLEVASEGLLREIRNRYSI